MLPSEERERVLREIKEALDSLQLQDPSFQYQMEEIDFAEPSEIDPEDEIVKISVEAIGEVTGERPKIKGFSGFTDARFYIKQCRIPTLILGPGGVDQSHTTNESVEVDALVKAAHIYGLIIFKFLSG
jgi:acetylornithine deacetylase/succinyl-diaminopimelate desuccinylase-like protein